MDEAIETVAITIAALRFAGPFSISLGDEERADVRAMAKPAPLTKSMLKGKKAAVRGTKITPPPTPEMGAMIPVSSAKVKRKSNHKTYSICLSPFIN